LDYDDDDDNNNNNNKYCTLKGWLELPICTGRFLVRTSSWDQTILWCLFVEFLSSL